LNLYFSLDETPLNRALTFVVYFRKIMYNDHITPEDINLLIKLVDIWDVGNGRMLHCLEKIYEKLDIKYVVETLL
jgi:hypothetical protein